MIDRTSDSQEQQRHLLQPQVRSSPILKKNATAFTVNSFPQKHDQSIDTINSKFTATCSTLSLNKDVKVSDMFNIVPPIITPPASHAKKILTVEYNKSLSKRSAPGRLNKFVRRLHEMLLLEQSSGIVEWRKGLLVLHSTDGFTKTILPKYFGTKNFKTFRRQLNYYGFVHVRSFSATGSTTTALWVNQDLAKRGTDSIASVLMLKRVEPSESSKTAEGRRVRKEEAANTVEDIGINTRTIQLEQIRNLAAQGMEKKQKQEQAKVIKIDSNLIVPIITVQNCHESQTGTDSTASITSSRESSTVSSPVPISINVAFTCTNHAHNKSICTSSANNQTVTVSDTSTDDAANLLMMFSRSTFQQRS